MDARAQRVDPAHYFGCCPRCRSADGPIHVNIWKQNYATCPDCRVYWWCGHGILSSGLYSTDAERAADVALLESYERIEDPGECPHPDATPQTQAEIEAEYAGLLAALVRGDANVTGLERYRRPRLRIVR